MHFPKQIYFSNTWVITSKKCNLVTRIKLPIVNLLNYCMKLKISGFCFGFCPTLSSKLK